MNFREPAPTMSFRTWLSLRRGMGFGNWLADVADEVMQDFESGCAKMVAPTIGGIREHIRREHHTVTDAMMAAFERAAREYQHHRE